jgi:hypothetical protein
VTSSSALPAFRYRVEATLTQNANSVTIATAMT